MLKSLYHWTLEKSRHPKAISWLTFISVLESFIFPIPLEVVLVPVALANRNKAMKIALFAVIGATIGALIGYGIGYFFFDLIGKDIIALFGKEEAFLEIQDQFRKHDWLVMLVAAITPLPFKVATITAGFMQSNLLTYIVTVFIGRFIRYGVICLLIKIFGKQIEQFIEQRFTLVLIIGTIVFLSGWLLLL